MEKLLLGVVLFSCISFGKIFYIELNVIFTLLWEPFSSASSSGTSLGVRQMQTTDLQTGTSVSLTSTLVNLSITPISLKNTSVSLNNSSWLSLIENEGDRFIRDLSMMAMVAHRINSSQSDLTYLIFPFPLLNTAILSPV